MRRWFHRILLAAIWLQLPAAYAGSFICGSFARRAAEWAHTDSLKANGPNHYPPAERAAAAARLPLDVADMHRWHAIGSAIWPTVGATLTISIAWLIYAGWSERRAALRFEAGRCVRCGYDLRATPGRCPECGADRG